jgi:hypothetical protein
MWGFDFDMTCSWPPWGLGSRSEIGVQPRLRGMVRWMAGSFRLFTRFPRLRGDGPSEIALIHNPD